MTRYCHRRRWCCYLVLLTFFFVIYPRERAYAASELWKGIAMEGCDPSAHPNFTIILPNNVDLTLHTTWAAAAAQKNPTSYKSQGQFDTGGAYASLCNDKDAGCAGTQGVVLVDHIDGQTIYGSFNIVSGKKVQSAEFSAVLKPEAKPPSCGL